MTDIDIRKGEQITLDILSKNNNIDLSIGEHKQSISLSIDEKGVSDYNLLTGKPKINSIIVEGSKSAKDYNLQNKMDILSIQEIEKILYLD